MPPRRGAFQPTSRRASVPHAPLPREGPHPIFLRWGCPFAGKREVYRRLHAAEEASLPGLRWHPCHRRRRNLVFLTSTTHLILASWRREKRHGRREIDMSDQLDRWNDEHDRLRAWYSKQCTIMKHKLRRILAGEIVYRNHDKDEKSKPRDAGVLFQSE